MWDSALHNLFWSLPSSCQPAIVNSEPNSVTKMYQGQWFPNKMDSKT